MGSMQYFYFENVSCVLNPGSSKNGKLLFNLQNNTRRSSNWLLLALKKNKLLCFPRDQFYGLRSCHKIEKCFYNFRVEPEFSVPLLFLGSYANMHVYEKNILIQENLIKICEDEFKRYLKLV